MAPNSDVTHALRIRCCEALESGGGAQWSHREACQKGGRYG